MLTFYSSIPHWRELGYKLILAPLTAGLLAACSQPTPPPTPTPVPLAPELIFYNWSDYMPQAVLDAFTQEYGVNLKYETYDSQEEAIANIKAGKDFDVAVIEHDFLPSLEAENLLAEIDYRHVINFKNISANFRDLVTDGGNRHSAPYNFGTTGLVVRTDLTGKPVTRWADLWDPTYAVRVALRQDQSTEMISLTAMSLGYALNTEDPTELEAVRQRLLALKPAIFFVDVDSAAALPYLLNGKAIIMVGWPGDVVEGRSQNPAIQYILPEDCPAIWFDTFVISAHSPHRYTAELFINFLLRPEVSAQIVNELGYASANEAARPFIKAELLNDTAVFPPQHLLKKAQFWLPLSPAGEKLYADIWASFTAPNQ